MKVMKGKQSSGDGEAISGANIGKFPDSAKDVLDIGLIAKKNFFAFDIALNMVVLSKAQDNGDEWIVLLQLGSP